MYLSLNHYESGTSVSLGQNGVPMKSIVLSGDAEIVFKGKDYHSETYFGSHKNWTCEEVAVIKVNKGAVGYIETDGTSEVACLKVVVDGAAQSLTRYEPWVLFTDPSNQVAHDKEMAAFEAAWRELGFPESYLS